MKSLLSPYLSVVCWHWSRGIGRSWHYWCWSVGRSGGIGRSWSVVPLLVMLEKALVRAGDSLVLDVSVVLLVLVNKVVHDLSPAVGQLHSVLTCNTLTG